MNKFVTVRMESVQARRRVKSRFKRTGPRQTGRQDKVRTGDEVRNGGTPSLPEKSLPRQQFVIAARFSHWLVTCSPVLATIVTMAIRVHYVTRDTSGWIAHPDEIYQSLEGMQVSGLFYFNCV